LINVKAGDRRGAILAWRYLLGRSSRARRMAEGNGAPT